MVRSFQISAVFPHLTVRDNVRIALQRPLGSSFHFWRSERGLDRLNDRARALLAAVGLAGFSRRGRRRAVLWPEAGARNRHDAGARSRDAAARRADGRAGPGGYRPHLGADRQVAADRTVLMVEHNLSVVADLSDTHHRVDPRPHSRRGRLRRRLRRTRRSSRPIWGPAMPERAGAAQGAAAVADLHAWYGESHVLHGMISTSARARW